MAKIFRLSPHVADLIAAGEVVDRPASVVKELVENSIDAGSRNITVEIQNGGMTLLRVTDDGCGIAPEDVETAFLRHATSKIRREEDLSHIHTLGFRGEALAATAAVSRISLLTKTAGSSMGVSLRLEAGNVMEKEDAGCPDGTTIVVRDLFYNTPARMKFMKRDSVEASAVVGAVQRQALAHPEIAFRCLKDGQEVLSTAGDGDLKSAVYQVYGRDFANGLTEVDGKWDGYTLHGFITRPTETRGNRAYQHFFVDGRYVRSRLLTAALEEGYRNQIMTGRFPGCVLFLTAPEGTVDVNVHPAKTEVKFLAEREVFDCVRYGTEAALRKAPARPDVTMARPIPQPPQPKAQAAAKQDFYRTMSASDFKQFLSRMDRDPVTAAPEVTKAVLRPKETAAEAPLAQQVQIPMPAPKKTPPAPQVQAEDAPWRLVGEVMDSYLIVEQGEDVFFVDKHAAHERILFEKYRAQERPVMAQTLLSPVAARLTAEEAAAVLEHTAELEPFGFFVEDFGDGAVLIRQIPADLAEDQAQSSLADLAEDLLAGKRLHPEELRDQMLHTVACKAAIKAGWHTSPEEKLALVEEVFRREDLKYCPHGRPICVRLTKHDLEKQFGRT